MATFKKLDEIVQSIGTYYGVPGKDSNLEWLKRFHEEEKFKQLKAELYSPPADPVSEIFGELQSKTANAPTTWQVCLKLNESLLKAKGPKDAAPGKDEYISWTQRLMVTYDGDMAGLAAKAANGLAAGAIMCVNTMVEHSKPNWTQGTPPGKSREDKPASIAEMLSPKLSAKARAGKFTFGDTSTKEPASWFEEAGSPINGVPSSEDPQYPRLAIFQTWDPMISIGTRDTGAVQIFMNAIPTLEWSKAIPYFDMVVIEKEKPLDSKGRLQTMGITQTLLGGGKVNEKTPGWYIAKSNDVDILRASNQFADRTEENVDNLDPWAPSGIKDPDFSTTGMELFCYPQTLVIRDGFSDYAQTLSVDAQDRVIAEEGGAAGGARTVAPLDRFRPLAGINSININIQSQIGFLAFKKATLEMTCFDRSRLHELGGFVRPDVFSKGQTLIQITHGWSHPAGSVSMADPVSNTFGSNKYGEFLNAARVMDMFVVTNSKFSFEDDGSVSITLTLNTQGAVDLGMVMISETTKVGKSKALLNDLVDEVNRWKKGVLADAPRGVTVNAPTFTNSVSTTDSAMTLSEEATKKLKKFLSQPAGSKDYGKLKEILVEVYGRKGTGGQVKKISDLIAEAITAKRKLMDTTPDPFLTPFTTNPASTVNPPVSFDERAFSTKKKYKGRGKTKPRGYKSKYISLGKVMAMFVGEPLAASGKFAEVQLIFYGFNNKASYMYDKNIAQFPCGKNTFETAFQKLAKTGFQMPVSTFMNFLRKEFVSNASSFPYGMRKFYDVKTDGNPIADEFKDATILENATKAVLRDAYRESDNPALEFKVPRLGFQIETLPQAQRTGQKKHERATVLRIHIYDAQNVASSASQEILRASFATSMGVIAGVAGKVETASSEGRLKGDHKKYFLSAMQKAAKAKIVAPIDGSSAKDLSAEAAAKIRWKVLGNFSSIKRWVSYSVPTISIASNNSAVTNADVNTMNNALLATVSWQRAKKKGDQGAAGIIGGGLPMQIAPVQLTLETLGCPLFEVGQELFVDMDTGTSADNIYRVASVTHNLSAGEFVTSVKMMNMEAYGVYRDAIENITDAIALLEHDKGTRQEGASTAGA